MLELQQLVANPAHVRTLVDSIPDRHMFVYPYIRTDLQLVRTTTIPPVAKKSILRDALTGLFDQSDGTVRVYERADHRPRERRAAGPELCGPREAFVREPLLEEPRSVGESRAEYPHRHLLFWHHGRFPSSGSFLLKLF